MLWAHVIIPLPPPMTSHPLLLYGATGYTGRLVLDAARLRGLQPILGGRNAAALAALAEQTGCEYRAASLSDPQALASALAGVRVVLLAAGPFTRTARPMVDACLALGIHYLDVTGECTVLESLLERSEAARRRGCTIMPGCGFDIVASDCLARHVANQAPDATRLALGISGLDTRSRGSLRTIAEAAGLPVRRRRNGVIVTVPPGTLRRRFDYGRGAGWSSAVSWGDVATAYFTTGIPDTDVFFEETPAFPWVLAASRTFGPILQTPLAQAWLKTWADLAPEGPTPIQRAAHSCVIVAEASAPSGRTIVSRMHTPEAYSLSARTAAAIAERALAGDVESGFQTPGRVYGADFVLQFDGVSREDFPE